jgi:hypothetical protein
MIEVGPLDGAGEVTVVDFEITANEAEAAAPLVVVSDAEGTRIMDVNLAAGDATCPRTIALDPDEQVTSLTGLLPRIVSAPH